MKERVSQYRCMTCIKVARIENNAFFPFFLLKEWIACVMPIISARAAGVINYLPQL